MALNKKTIIGLFLSVLMLGSVLSCKDQNETSSKEEAKSSSGGHPKLIITKAGVEEIRKNLGNIPIFDASLEMAKEEVDAEIEAGIDTPIPKDFSGGYTHVRHKRNFFMLEKAGLLYQILDDEKYAKYVKDMFFQYADMYKDLPVHPQTRSYARGKLFWQCLNDSNWLVYASQGYDCIYEYLTPEERETLERDLFRPFADFISIGNPKFYNRVHNHSTWGNAAVGMIALVMDDDELLQRALYGIENDGLDPNEKDNDGGYIKDPEGRAGFLANLEEPFSPDGYYTEGPYYQRYAMYPFLIFSEALNNVKPELKIFEHKDGVLLKAVDALLNLSDADGDFFPLNDGQKGMSYYSKELVTAVDIAYLHGGKNPGLLSIAEKQNRVLLDDSGLAIALGIKKGETKPFNKKSVNLSDGPDGKQGGVAVLRNDDLEVVFKYAAQGLSHGHYDKLSFSMYENGQEVIQDYGLARFVNIEQKGGGNYLKENKTWAKQTIAHNTVTQNETSHFQGKYEIGSKHHSVLDFYDFSNANIKVVSAHEANAYPGTVMHRTMAVITDKDFEKPYVLDLMRVTSDKANQYDFPYYFLGQVMETNFKYSTPETLKPLGSKHGYQHLFVEGQGKASQENVKLSWLNAGRFHTLTTVTNNQDEVFFTRIGAADPEFNLRKEPAIMLRKSQTKDAVFASVIESHGGYSPVSENAVNSHSNISKIKVIYNDADYTAVSIVDLQGNSKVFIVSNKTTSKEKKHNLKINDNTFQWTGSYYFK
ncbi:alginate lyase family protein [Tamlana sp. 2_MG-2023]|uniref:alginate lyase family protein n=1 Tax=unclassified Tamlana TaxID=2614803 RepID=UPI0026E21816|nr:MULTISPECIES: alginate lyase family protein [unclassified Tamlana]MDO6760480.1 alginate lyase family protein [Tamlana sp. 2_MG-2023]MDO6790736.1 alginate lyase family protein [Tamlana sp. 1_MG-2023]